MSNEYPVEVRRAARRLWLTGRYTDEQIAAQLGIPRPDTIRDWRHQEGWADLAHDFSTAVETEVKERARAARAAFDEKYDHLGQVIEGRAVRQLNNPNLSARDLKAISGTLLNAQRMREKALGCDQPEAPVDDATTFADLVDRAQRRQGRLRRGVTATMNAPGMPVEREPPTDLANTATGGIGAVSVASA